MLPVIGIFVLLLLSSTSATNLTQSDLQQPSQSIDSFSTCQPNPELSAVLLQMLVSSMKQPTKTAPAAPAAPAKAAKEDQQLLPDLKAFDVDLNDVQAAPTTLVTSTLVSTITQTLSRVVSIWFRNVRIPTTIFTKKQQVVTDYITVTSTLQVRPTLLRHKREHQPEHQLEHQLEQEDHPLLQSSFPQSSALLPASVETPQLSLESIFRQPKVLQAWNQFISALQEAGHQLDQPI